MTSCLLPWQQSFLKVGSTLKGKNLLLESKFFPLCVDPIQNEEKMTMGVMLSFIFASSLYMV